MDLAALTDLSLVGSITKILEQIIATFIKLSVRVYEGVRMYQEKRDRERMMKHPPFDFIRYNVFANRYI